MFGKIKYISDNTAVVEINKDGNLVSNLMNLHVVFESNGDKLWVKLRMLMKTL